MPAYDAIRFTPPAPLALVTLRNAASKASVSDVPMLLDSGADVTLLPRSSVERLGISIDPKASYQLMSFDEKKRGQFLILATAALPIFFCCVGQGSDHTQR